MTDEIELFNPESDNFPAFIYANSLECEDVCHPGTAAGQHIVICGAGPSLAEHTDLLQDADQVWGCNSALTWLHDNGHRVTHGFAIDQTPQMIGEWFEPPDAEYMLASTCHPHLVEFLRSKNRRIRFFHNFVGISMPAVVTCDCTHSEEEHDGGCTRCDCGGYDPVRVPYENWLYALLYDRTVMLGSGLNSVTRAIDLANFYGAGKITVLGADCALQVNKPKPPGADFGTKLHRDWLRDHTVMHADGGNALASNASALTFGGEIDGRWWETKPDLVITAVWLVKMAQEYPHLELVGDTLPNALKDKPEDFLARLPTLRDSTGKPLKYEITKIQDFSEMLTADLRV